MKNLVSIVMALIIMSGLLLTGCPAPAPTSVPEKSKPTAPAGVPEKAQTAAPTGAAEKAKPTTPASVAAQPQRGGTLRLITDKLGANFGYPGESYSRPPSLAGFAEPLAQFDEKENLVPVLALSWSADYATSTMTIRLRQGVKFHDGTDFNAEAVKWNLEMHKAADNMGGSEYIKSITAVDNYTVRLNLSQVSPLTLEAYLQYPLMFSPAATQAKGKEWARTNPVGTGPFKLTEFQREAFIKLVRFDGYWQPGMPYLDSIEVRVIPDPLTAATTMQAGDADMWVNQAGLPLKEASDLSRLGLKAASVPGRYYTMSPDTTNPKSKFANQKVREAIEYAIDRAAIAKAIGEGLAEPLNQIAPSASVFYNKDYKGRPYDPAKAKALLAEAGVATGLEIFLVTPSRSPEREFATTVQGYLKAVGIDAKLTLKDSASWTALRMGDADWEGLLMQSEVMNPGLSYIQNFTKNFQLGGRAKSLARSKEFLAIIDKIYATNDNAAIAASGRQLVKQVSDEAMTIPLAAMPSLSITQKNVHSTYLIESPVSNYWNTQNDWIEKK